MNNKISNSISDSFMNAYAFTCRLILTSYTPEFGGGEEFSHLRGQGFFQPIFLRNFQYKIGGQTLFEQS